MAINIFYAAILANFLMAILVSLWVGDRVVLVLD